MLQQKEMQIGIEARKTVVSAPDFSNKPSENQTAESKWKNSDMSEAGLTWDR